MATLILIRDIRDTVCDIMTDEIRELLSRHGGVIVLPDTLTRITAFAGEPIMSVELGTDNVIRINGRWEMSVLSEAARFTLLVNMLRAAGETDDIGDLETLYYSYC